MLPTLVSKKHNKKKKSLRWLSGCLCTGSSKEAERCPLGTFNKLPETVLLLISGCLLSPVGLSYSPKAATVNI